MFFYEYWIHTWGIFMETQVEASGDPIGGNSLQTGKTIWFPNNGVCLTRASSFRHNWSSNISHSSLQIFRGFSSILSQRGNVAKQIDGMAYCEQDSDRSGDTVITVMAAVSFCSMYSWLRPSVINTYSWPMYLAQTEPTYGWQVPENCKEYLIGIVFI